MKICYVATTTHVGKEREEAIGASTHVYELAQKMTSFNHEVYVVSEKILTDEKTEEKIANFYVTRFSRIIPKKLRRKKNFIISFLKPLKIISVLKLAWQTVQLIRNKNIDVIIERSQSLGVGAVASFLTGVPLYVEVIDDQYSILSLFRAKRIFVYTKQVLPLIYRNKAIIVVAGVNTEIYRPVDTIKKYDLGFIGAFKPWEGLENFIEALDILKKKGKNIKTLLVGTGVLFDKIQELIKEKGLEKEVTCVGKVRIEDVAMHLSQAKIGIAPYCIENVTIGNFKKYGFYFSPLKVVEYLACGLPVLASKYRLIEEIIQPPEYGLTFYSEDMHAIAYKILFMLENIHQWKQKDLCKHAHEYSWDRVAEKMLKAMKKRK